MSGDGLDPVLPWFGHDLGGALSSLASRLPHREQGAMAESRSQDALRVNNKDL